MKSSAPEESAVLEKKTNPILLRLPDSLDARLKRAARQHVRGRQQIIRDGLVSELERLEATRGSVTAAEARAIAAARRVGLDPVEALLCATNAHLAEQESARSHSVRGATALLTHPHD